MSQGRAEYITDYRCPKCGRLLAESDGRGGLLIDGVPVVAISGKCPECDNPFSYPSLGLEVGTTALDELIKVASMIEVNGGFGVLRVTFAKFKVRRIGLETDRDVCQ